LEKSSRIFLAAKKRWGQEGVGKGIKLNLGALFHSQNGLLCLGGAQKVEVDDRVKEREVRLEVRGNAHSLSPLLGFPGKKGEGVGNGGEGTRGGATRQPGKRGRKGRYGNSMAVKGEKERPLGC